MIDNPRPPNAQRGSERNGAIPLRAELAQWVRPASQTLKAYIGNFEDVAAANRSVETGRPEAV